MPIIFHVLITCGLAFYGHDQHSKRVAEQGAFRQRIDEMEKQINALKAVLGTKSEQVRLLASLLEKFKRENGMAA